MANGKPRSKTKLRVVENLILLAIFLVAAYLLNNYFFTVPVIVSVLKGVALIAVLAMAESIVLAVGGIDLSVAGVGLLSASVIFYLVETGLTGVVPAVLVSLVIGAVIGFINGFFVAKLRINSIIVTMGTALLARGVSGAMSNNIIIFNSRPEFAFFKSVSLYVIPTSLIIALLIMMLCWAVFRFTVVGRQVFAVGGSERSAKLSGLKVGRIKTYAYLGTGVLAAVGGLMVLADSAVAARFFGAGADIEIILAAVIGGVSLYGGASIFFRACIGASLIAVLNRIIYGLLVFDYMRALIVGAVVLIVIAVKKNMFQREKIE